MNSLKLNASTVEKVVEENNTDAFNGVVLPIADALKPAETDAVDENKHTIKIDACIDRLGTFYKSVPLVLPIVDVLQPADNDTVEENNDNIITGASVDSLGAFDKIVPFVLPIVDDEKDYYQPHRKLTYIAAIENSHNGYCDVDTLCSMEDVPSFPIISTPSLASIKVLANDSAEVPLLFNNILFKIQYFPAFYC